MHRKLFILSILILNILGFSCLKSYWQKINNGLIDTTESKINWLDLSISDVMVFNNSIYITTYKNGVFVLSNNGNNWIKKNNGIKGDSIFLANLSNNNKYIFCAVKKLYYTYLDTLTGKWKSDSTGISGIYYSTDGGENWQSTKRNGLADSNYISAIAANDSILVVGTDNEQGVYISKDNGENWVHKNNGLNTQAIYSIQIKDNYIYLGSSGGVYISSDMGENWSNKLSSMVYTLYLKGDTIIAGSWYSGFNMSTDNGETWIKKNNGLREKSVTAIASINDYIFIGINPSTIFRDPEAGVHFSSNGGDTWHTTNKGFAQTGVRRLAIKDEYIFCAISFGNVDSTFGMYRAKISDLINATNVEYETLREEHFYTAPTKPNPARDIVRADIYWDAEAFNVEYAGKGIYNIMGNKVGDKKDLQVTNIQPYSAEIIWNCSRFSSGLYFIVIDYNNKTKAIPVIISK